MSRRSVKRCDRPCIAVSPFSSFVMTLSPSLPRKSIVSWTSGSVPAFSTTDRLSHSYLELASVPTLKRVVESSCTVALSDPRLPDDLSPLTATSSRVVNSGIGSNEGGNSCHASDSIPKRSSRSFVKRMYIFHPYSTYQRKITDFVDRCTHYGQQTIDRRFADGIYRGLCA